MDAAERAVGARLRRLLRFHPSGGPGFLPAYASVINGDWTILYGLPNDPSGYFRLLAALNELDWFAPADRFPPAVSVVVRGIDWAYWEVFARDRGIILAVHERLKAVLGLKVEVNHGPSEAVKSH